VDRSLGRADAGHEYGRADARPILWYGQRDFLPHPIPIEQLNLLCAMARAQLLNEIPDLAPLNRSTLYVRVGPTGNTPDSHCRLGRKIQGHTYGICTGANLVIFSVLITLRRA
jgi:hypothetical protein